MSWAAEYSIGFPGVWDLGGMLISGCKNTGQVSYWSPIGRFALNPVATLSYGTRLAQNLFNIFTPNTQLKPFISLDRRNRNKAGKPREQAQNCEQWSSGTEKQPNTGSRG